MWTTLQENVCTKVHCDTSSEGLSGMLLQRSSGGGNQLYLVQALVFIYNLTKFVKLFLVKNCNSAGVGSKKSGSIYNILRDTKTVHHEVIEGQNSLQEH